MTVAINEILKQIEFLSLAEQAELGAKISEQARQNLEAAPHNGLQVELEAASSAGINESVDAEEDDWIDTLDLQLMPWKQIATTRVSVREVGRLQPLPYDFGDFFDDEEEGE